MTTRRTMVWLILMLVTVPTVAAAADTVQRLSEGEAVVRAGPFHEGERFAYDLTFRSLFHEVDSTIEDFVVIEVGHVGTMRLADGTETPVLPLYYQMETPPWRLVRGEIEDVSGVVYLRVPDATVVQVERAEDSIEFEQDPEGAWARTERAHSETVYGAHRRGPVNGTISDPLTSGTTHPGDTFVNGNPVIQTMLYFVGIGGGHVYGTGAWDGETVYEVERSTWEMDAPNSFSCDLRQPRIVYDDREGQERAGATGLTGTERSSSWITTRHPLPVQSTCASRYTAGDKVVEEVDLQLTLADHVPGGAAVPLKRDHSSAPRAAPLEAEPVILPGLPAPGGLRLAFPPEEAVSVLMRAPELLEFRDSGAVPFIVTGFWYHAQPRAEGALAAPPAPVPDPLGLLPTESRTEREVYTSWWLTLENQDHVTASVRLERTIDATGEVVEEELNVEDWGRGRATANGKTFTADEYPEEMVPFGTIVDAWLAHRGEERSDWHALPYRSVSMYHAWGASNDLRYIIPTYQIQSGVYGEQEGAPDWSSHQGTFDALDGALMRERTDTSTSQEVSDRPSGTAPLNTGAVQVVSQGHVPAAATASGLAVLLAFVVAFFWDGIARVVIAPFYAKIHKNKVLDHATRDRIVDYVTANPGAALGAVRAHIGSGYGTAVHHLDTLERNGILVSRKVGRVRCYFPPGTLSPGEMDGMAAAGTSAASRFLDIVTNHPGLTQREIAQRLGVADSSVRYQAKRLLEHSQVRAVRDGRQVRYHPVHPLVEA